MMLSNWGDVKSNIINAFISGVALMLMAFISIVILSSYCAIPKESANLLERMNVAAWGIMFGVIFQCCFYDSSVTACSHGRVCKIADFVGSNGAFFLPFVTAFFFLQKFFN